MFATQTEYPVELPKRFGLVAFAGFGGVAKAQPWALICQHLRRKKTPQVLRKSDLLPFALYRNLTQRNTDFT